MIDKLQAIKDRFEEVGQLIVQPDAMADMKQFSKLSKEYKDLEKIVEQLSVKAIVGTLLIKLPQINNG